MSKRAEELARNLYKNYCFLAQPNESVDVHEIVELIDAALREERKRCALRVRAIYIMDVLLPGEIGALMAAIASDPDE